MTNNVLHDLVEKCVPRDSARARDEDGDGDEDEDGDGDGDGDGEADGDGDGDGDANSCRERNRQEGRVLTDALLMWAKDLDFCTAPPLEFLPAMQVPRALL